MSFQRMLLLAGTVSMFACNDAAKRPSDVKAGTVAPAHDSAAPVAASRDADPPEVADPRQYLNLGRMRWEGWETKPPADRFARLRELGITPNRNDTITGRVEDGYDPAGERAEDFHFVDFSGDGVADVIYDGAWFEINTEGQVAGMEGTRLKMYQVIGGRAVEVMEHHGSILRLWRARPGDPPSLLIEHVGCCSEELWSVSFYRPVLTGGKVGYEHYRTVLGRQELDVPKQFTGSGRRFTVTQDGYLLRAAPRIDTTDVWPNWGDRGNAMAVYTRGARGTAYAERRDATGRVWWFVRMDGRTPPAEAQIRDEPDSPVLTDRIGWMSSRFLTTAP
ncbi:MAG TPA: hypothetical protein VF647_24700 [Longimicrobium sp.]